MQDPGESFPSIPKPGPDDHVPRLLSGNGHGWPFAAPREDREAGGRPLVHVVLFLATLLTTTMAGANILARGINPLRHPEELLSGIPFAATLMAILAVHELGHYVASRIHGVRATLPYFIPGPPVLIGTFGAFIRMKSPPLDRRALFDVGAAGPWAGVLLAIPAVVIGLGLSEIQPLDGTEPGLFFGESILFSLLARAALGVSPDEVTILLHPVALAGWIGLFVTFLNLIPIGQLDGGHVFYALLGPGHRWTARVCLVIIAALGFYGWPGWFLWTFILLFLGVEHPPTLDRITPLDPRRRLAAWATAALFVVTFIPVPFSTVEELPRIPAFDGPAVPARLDPAPPVADVSVRLC